MSREQRGFAVMFFTAAVLRQVACHGQRHADQAALGGAVGLLADLAVEGGDRGGEQHDAALAVGQRLELRAGGGEEATHVVGADQVDVDDAGEVFQRRRAAVLLHDALGGADAGDVHQDAGRAVRGGGLRDGGLGAFGAGHVALHGDAADVGRDGGDRLELGVPGAVDRLGRQGEGRRGQVETVGRGVDDVAARGDRGGTTGAGVLGGEGDHGDRPVARALVGVGDVLAVDERGRPALACHHRQPVLDVALADQAPVLAVERDDVGEGVGRPLRHRVPPAARPARRTARRSGCARPGS